MIPPPDRAALEGAPEEVAPRLLGWRLTHDSAAGPVTVRVTEVEAYAGEDDPPPTPGADGRPATR